MLLTEIIERAQQNSWGSFTDLSENNVTGYRLYFLDGQGHVWRALEIECETDAEAVRVAQKQQPGGPMELWSLARVVAKFERSCEAA